MADRSGKIQPGDVFEVAVDVGFGHIQFIGTHAEYGAAIRVVPSVNAKAEDIVASLFEGNSYITFYPVRAALSKKLIRKVGHLPVPSIPQRLRRAGVRIGRQVETWIIEDETGETLCRSLSESQLSLPIAAIWNHEFLVHRIREGWHPRRGDAA